MGVVGGSRFGDRPPELEPPDSQVPDPVPVASARSEAPQPSSPLQSAAWAWATEHKGAGLMEAFLAGYLYAQQQAPPAPTFTPAGKAARTIAAALTYFREQVLVALQPEEIATGEFCSVEEVEAMIRTFTEKGQS